MRGHDVARHRLGFAIATVALCSLVFAVDAVSGGASSLAGGLRGDPYVQVGPELVGSASPGTGLFGISGAISGDASTVIVGAPTEGSSGAAYIYTPSGSAWTQQAELTDPSLPSMAYLGDSAAISGDGNTVLVGAPNAREVLVFTRSGTTWSLASTITAPLTITGFGGNVALSSAGTTALIGDSGSTGASNVTTAIIYNFAGGSWHQGAVLSPSGEAPNGGSFSDASVALSADASTALVGNPADSGGNGSAWVFVQGGGSWTQQGGRLTGSGEIGTGGFGGSAALSANGDTAAIGAIYDDCNNGAGYVFARSGTTWSQQSSKLTNIGLLGTCGVGGPTFGEGAALSGDGTTAFFGGGDPAVFTLTGSTWGPLQTDLAGGGQTSLSSDGQTGLATCGGCNAGAGTAYVYHFVAGAVLPAPAPSALMISPSPMAGVRISTAASGVLVHFKVNVKAAAKLQVLERQTGVLAAGNCVAASAGVTGSSCTRLVQTTVFTFPVHAGRNSYSVPASAVPVKGGYELRLIVMRPRSRRNGLAMKPFTIKG
jgi:hypothetical protein